MANFWDGSVDTDYTTVGNWKTGAFPVGGEDWTFDDRAQRSLLLNVDRSGVSFGNVVISNTELLCGTALNPLKFTKINNLDFRSFGDCHLFGDIDTVDAFGLGGGVNNLVLDCTFDRLNLMAGNCRVIGTRVQPAGSLIYVDSIAGANQAKLVFDDNNVNLVTNSLRMHVSGDALVQSVISLKDVIQSGGTITLADSADGADTPAVTGSLQQVGGLFNWESSGNVANAHIGGNATFTTGNKNRTKTLTACTMYADAIVNLAECFDLALPSGGIIVLGRNQPIFPRGSVVDVP